jgi:ribonucleoside-triphosphate reductase
LLDTIKHNVTEGMGVEEISDLVEIELMRVGLYKTAKRYILWREERAKERGRGKKHRYKYLSNEFLSKYKHIEPFENEIGKFTYLRTYARMLPKEGRRETWLESVARTVDYNVGLAKWKTENQAVCEAEVLFDNIFYLRQFPSGRALFSAGEKPSYQNPISQFNCSFAVFDNFDIVKDAMYLLMLGVGFGFSVEEQYVDLLPKVRGDIQVVHKSFEPVQKHIRKESTEYNVSGDIMEIIVGDSKIGWSSAVDILLRTHYSIEFAHVNAIIVNYNHVRPFNEPLKTFGGFASGHSALQTMITKIDKVLKKDNHSKKRLQPVDCADIIDITAESIVVGGTRRSACSVLMSESDMEMRNAKQKLYTQDVEGNWVIDQDIIHRQMSNNSIAFWKKPSYDDLKKQFDVIKQSAESNFFNMESAQKRMPNVKGTNPLTFITCGL